jgi:hypothetical protein
MGKRREPRHEIRVPVRIFGTDRNGRVFSEKVFTANVSRQGVELTGVQAEPANEEIIGLTYGQTKIHFRVKWTGAPNTPKAGHMGLLNLTPEKSLWDFPLPGTGMDDFRPRPQAQADRRAYPRMKTNNSIELYAASQAAPIRAKATDLSLGGCFVEMSMPLEKGSAVKIALWIQDYKLWANAKVITSTPGFGVGLQFTEISKQDSEQLRQFVKNITRILA